MDLKCNIRERLHCPYDNVFIAQNLCDHHKLDKSDSIICDYKEKDPRVTQYPRGL